MAREIGGGTQLCGVMGDPIAHTLSPAIHNYLAEATGVDMVYVPFRIKKEYLETGVAGAFRLGVKGLNITVPHKQSIMRYLSYVDHGAETIGAVNTLVGEQRGYRGFNTDWIGMSRALAHEKVYLQDEHVVILGAGGTANAAAFLCGYDKAATVTVLNRTPEKALLLAKKMGEVFPKTTYMAKALSDWNTLREEKYISIQTTSVGMRPNDGAAPIEEEAFYEKLSAAMDVIYSPLETRYMQLSRMAGVKTFNGLNMLLYQAVEAFELIHSVSVEEGVVANAREHLRRILKNEA